jgi:hypothetical protein
MKKTVLTFGLISGAISSSLMMLVTMPLAERIGFDNSEVLGYTTIVLSFLMVYVGVRSYRENNGGAITFGRALGVGLLITVISCGCYVASWEILYFNFGFGHEFLDKYSAYQTEKARASGASAEALQTQQQEMQKFKQMYDNPLFNSAMTFMEPFPVGLVVSLISAAVLRKKKAAQAVNAQPVTS